MVRIWKLEFKCVFIFSLSMHLTYFTSIHFVLGYHNKKRAVNLSGLKLCSLFPPAADGSKYRLTDIMKRERNPRTHSSKWDVSIKSVPWKFSEPHGRGIRKNERTILDGGHQENKVS